MILEIEPYVGAAPFIFGLPESFVESRLGPPLYRTKPPHVPGTEEIDYRGLSFAFNRNGKLMQMVFNDRFDGKVMFNGIDLLDDPDALGKLLALDGDAHLWVGFVMLMGLGMSLGGYHEFEEGGRTVSIFERGRYDAKIPRFTPFGHDSNSGNQ